MIITRIMGGMGNQLFQYAMALRLAKTHSVELKLDLTNYCSGSEPRPDGLESFSRKLRLLEFCITAKEASHDEIASLRDSYQTSSASHRLVRLIRRLSPNFAWPATHLCERQFRFDPAMLQLPSSIYLQGFWQSERYFAEIAPAIREEFRLRNPSIIERAKKTVAALKTNLAPVVSLHIRRGDLAHANEVLKRPDQAYGAPVTLDYIHRAMAQFPQDSAFLVFSDTPQDIAWCRDNIRASDRIAFSEAQSDLEDFATMSACDHHIISNSTFSWWAAWLNPGLDKRVVAPRVWSSPEAPMQMPTDDLLPDAWLKL